ncbi:S9 family peptidase [Pigmentiphaga aceris]|uniref:S9 family peptidase n=1 Tax=Pigmentiphaga aceris TaxID=1940612 RepID=A0A5C0AWM3_9BURK|nr:S9 family peptidase [Pigmentiphaga aceris]QEI06575.1 S9 family peptidase [Pigmentiphaga aceris]
MTTPFTPSDIFNHRTISSTNGSPSENLLACAVTSLNSATDGENSAIWAVPLDAGAPWQMTQGGSIDNTPQWSPDGERLAFISNRAGNYQLFVMPRHGGEAVQLSQGNFSLVSYEWSPDGSRIAAVCAVTVDPSLRGARPDPNAVPAPVDGPQVVWKLPYKMDGVGYILNREMRLFMIDAASGEATPLTDGPFDVKAARWSPDGKQLVYVRTREGDMSHRTDVWVMDTDGHHARQLTTDHAQVLYPLWSPDGRWIVFAGTIEEGDAKVRPWLIEVASGKVQALGDEDIELSFEADSMQFVGKDASKLLAVLASRGIQHVCEISIPDGQIKVLADGDRHLSKLCCTPDYVAYTSENSVLPMEIHACRHDGKDERAVSHFNDWWCDRAPATMERRQFVVPDGDGGTETIDGWLIRPVGAKGAAPLLMDAHGGPASYALFDYPVIAYWPVLWSQGWSILALNAVGSSSYGRAFADRLNQRWGEIDLPQYTAAVAQLQAEGIADDRVCIAGKSYGGYLSAWAVGNSTLFRAAVVMAPVANMETHYGTSDSGYYSDSYTMQGNRAETHALIRKVSPVHYVHQAITPTLILQGTNDERCPRSQAEELFVTIRRETDTPCEMVLYPGGTHKFTSTGKPSHRQDTMSRIVEWVTRWVDQHLVTEASTQQNKQAPIK